MPCRAIAAQKNEVIRILLGQIPEKYIHTDRIALRQYQKEVFTRQKFDRSEGIVILPDQGKDGERMKYLEDNRRKLQGQGLGQTVQKQPAQISPKTPAPAQKTSTAPAPMEQQNTPQQPMEQQTRSQTGQVPAAPRGGWPPAQGTTPGTGGVVQQAQQLLSLQPGAYQSKWGSSIEDVLEQLLNPKEFTYDPSTDPLYLQMRDQHIRDGQLAMEDTMGYAAQLTGGYGNSHAQMLGQQTYQGYLQEVNDMVPQLRQQARTEYDAQNALLLQQLGLLMDQDSQDYSRYLDEINRQYQLERDALSDQRYDREWQYQQERDALGDQRYDREWQYQQERDQLSDSRYDQEWQYQQGQDAYDRLLEMIISTGYQPTAEELAAAGMTEAQAKAWRGYYDGTSRVSRSGGSGGSGSGSSVKASAGGNQSSDNGGTTQQHNVHTREELGDPLKKEDYTTVYANCAVYAGNGASASELAAYIKEALADGSISQEQYRKLIAQFGNLVDSASSAGGTASSSSGGRRGGPVINDRYNAFN